MKTYSYSQQAQAIDTCRIAAEAFVNEHGGNITESIEAARVAQTSLLALAMIGDATILRAQKLEAVAREIVNMVFENRGTIYDDEAVELKEKLQKILGEWEPGDPDMNGPNQAERDEMHHGYQNLK